MGPRAGGYERGELTGTARTVRRSLRGLQRRRTVAAVGIKFDDQTSTSRASTTGAASVAGRPGGRRRRHRRRGPDHLHPGLGAGRRQRRHRPSWCRRTARSRSRAAATSDLETRCNTEGAIDKYDDCFLVKVYNEINEVWTAEFQRRGETYEQPGLASSPRRVQHRLRPGVLAGGPVLLPAGPAASSSTSASSSSSSSSSAPRAATRRPTSSPTRPGTTCRRCSAPSARCARLQQANPGQQNELSVAHGAAGRLLRRGVEQAGRRAGNVSISDAELDQALRRGRGGRRRPHPAADPGPGRPGVLDPRLGRQRKTWFTKRRTSRRRQRLRHLQGPLTGPVRPGRDRIVAAS